MVRITEYLAMDETNHPQELWWGTIVREPAAPSFVHQRIVLRLAMRLEAHAAQHASGVVVPAPIDVVLDTRRHLILQPDIAFVRAERRDICREQIWGAPDLVVEVLSHAKRRDQLLKTAWYREYGVEECWIVDPVSREVTIGDHVYEGTMRVSSTVLPGLEMSADEVFDDRE